MKYQVDFKPSAARELRKLPKDIAKRISKKIDSLADNPFPRGYIEMKGSKEFYRVKEGDYRIIYTVEHGELIILVVRIGHRREIYR